MYFNTLIIMNEDTSGYGNRSRKPSGYCKLAMPNKVICYVQGLRQLPKGHVYRLYLTSKSKDQSVEVGMFQVGASGNKETRWLMDPSNINNSEIAAMEIDGALIKVDGDNIKETVVPLVGFSTEPYSWQHLLKVEPPKESPEPVKKPAVEAVEVETPKVAKAKVVKPQAAKSEDIKAEQAKVEQVQAEQVKAEEVKQEQIQKDTRQENEIALLKEEVKQLNRTIRESKEMIERLQKSHEENNRQKVVSPPKKEAEIEIEAEVELAQMERAVEKPLGINDYINNFIRKFQATEKQEDRVYPKEAESIFEKRIPINPFEVRNTGIRWVRINYDDLATLPSLDKEWINQPFIESAYRDYKHFILGRDQSGLTYYLGIPDMFDPEKESALEIDKIEKFSCCHNVAPGPGEAGYWIARL